MTVSRRAALALGGSAVLAPGLSLRSFAQPRLAYDIVPKQIAYGLWMIQGTTEYFTRQNGGAIVNCVLLETDDGMLVIDSGPSLRYGEALRLAINQMGDGKIAGVINTHHHPDHFLGNQAFEDAPIFALGETKALAIEHGDAFTDNMYNLLGDWMRGTESRPPDQELDGGTFEIGGRKLEALPLSGHTEADLAILDEVTGTVIAGDLAFLDRAPTTPSADLDLWRTSLEFIEEIEAAAIIPGHGPVDPTRKSLTQTRAYLDWLETALKTAASEGLDMIEIMDTAIPAEFAQMGAMPQEFHRSISHLFSDIENEALPRAN